MRAVAKAHANIALVKYWGKRNESLILPMNGSISMTLRELSVVTAVEFHPRWQTDQLIINGSDASRTDLERMTRFLNIVRDLAQTDWRAHVVSRGNVPLASGLASSSSAYAALATASTEALRLHLDRTHLSILARQGSGSAARSIYGGFVEWTKGERDDGTDSYARLLCSPDSWDLSMVIAIVGYGAKKISSREGMARVVATSVFYRDWLNTVDDDLDNARRAILQRDFTTLGQITEASTYKMHATTMGASPPFCYWQAPTLEVIHQVEKLRDHGIECYASVDAGPHVGILCKDVNAHRICEAVSGILGIAHVLITRPGPETKIEESFNEA